MSALPAPSLHTFATRVAKGNRAVQHHGRQQRQGSSTTWPMLAELTAQPAALLEKWPARAGLAETLRLEPSSTYTSGLRAEALPWEGENERRQDRTTKGERESEERQRARAKTAIGPYSDV